MTNETLNATLYKKMFTEQKKYRQWLLTQPAEEILRHSYEYNIRQDILCTLEYFENCERLKDSVNGNIDTTYGLKGNVASWGNMNGGAEQHTSPLNGLQMERLGVIREESDYE